WSLRYRHLKSHASPRWWPEYRLCPPSEPDSTMMVRSRARAYSSSTERMWRSAGVRTPKRHEDRASSIFRLRTRSGTDRREARLWRGGLLLVLVRCPQASEEGRAQARVSDACQPPGSTSGGVEESGETGGDGWTVGEGDGCRPGVAS